METPYDQLYKKIWDLAPNAHDVEAYHHLNQLTQKLIQIYDAQGRLTEDPFASTSERTLS